MKKLIAAGVALVLSAGVCAGKFEVWTQQAGKGTVALVSYQGEGTSQEAQLDLTYPTGFHVTASTKVAGSVCAVFAEKSMIRIVPPSGAGTALTSNATDYCSFAFVGKGVPTLKKAYSECVPSSECAVAVRSTDSK